MKTKQFNQEFEQILLGSLLGDGNLFISNTSICPIFQEKHKTKHKSYLLWKHKIFSKNFRISYYLWNGKADIFKRGKLKKYSNVMFRTNSDKRLLKYYNLFYPNGKKQISEEILNKLNWLGIAVWFCDDGDYVQRGNHLSLSMHPEDRKIIYNFFNKIKFNSKLDGNHKIRFNVEDTKKIKEKIEKYILKMPRCMHYKIGKDKKILKFALFKKKSGDKKYYIKNYNLIRKKQKEYWNKNKNLINKKRRKSTNNVDNLF